MENEKTALSNMRKIYNTLYKVGRGQIFKNILKEVYGDDYIDDLGNDNFISMTDLQKIAKNLNISSNEIFIDVGCGRGGPGMWIARELGARYFGFDLSEIGISVASSRVKEFGLEGRAQFKVGDICATDFPDNCFHGAIGIDSLGFVQDSIAAVNEIARILRKGARFVVTCWEEENTPSMKDIRFLLRGGGFNIKIFEEIVDWERRQRKIYEKILNSKKILIKEIGRDAAFIPIMEAKQFLPRLKEMRHILVVAEKS